MRKGLAVILLSLWVLSAAFIPQVVGEDPSLDGDISFQPNIIPFLNVTSRVGRNNESFRFEWLNNTFDIEVFFNATLFYKKLGKNVTRLWSLKDFEDDFNVTVDYQVHKNESSVQFGWLVEGVEDISDFVHNAWFKIEDTQPFDYEDIELEEIEVLEAEEPYNITRFILPDNLVLSFEDLYHKGFVIGSQNKTSTSVKGFSGKSSWNLDPITYSSPTITVIGGTEGTPLDFKDIWDADQAGGWNVVINNNNTNTQYEFNARMVFGNATVAGTTYFNDTNKQVVFNDGVISAHGQRWMDVTRYAYLTFGVLEDLTDKSTSQGCSFLSLENSYQSYLEVCYVYNTQAYFYSCSVEGLAGAGFLMNGVNLRFWNGLMNYYTSVIDTTSSNVFNTIITKTGNGIAYPRGTWDKVTIFECTNVLYIRYAGTISNLYVRECTNLWRDSAFNNVNLYLIDCDSDVWTGVWTGGSGELWRQYSFDLTVTYPNGTAIQNANVTVTHYGQGETQDFTELTDASGQIAQKTLSMGFYNQTGGDTIYSYNDYNLQITNATGYQDYNGNFTLSEKTEWTITLQPKTGFTTGFGTGFIIALMIGLIFVLAGIAVKTKKGN